MEWFTVVKVGVIYMGNVYVSRYLKEELAWVTDRHEPIMFFKLSIMLLSNAPKFSQLAIPNYA